MFSIQQSSGASKKLYSQNKKLYSLNSLPSTPRYRGAQKININESMKDEIQERLDMEARSQKTFRSRMKVNDYYLESNYNPFSDLDGKTKQSLVGINRQFKNRLVNIVDRTQGIDKKRQQRRIMSIKTARQNFQTMQVDFQLKSKNLIYNIEKSDRQKFNIFVDTPKMLREKKQLKKINLSKSEEAIQVMDIEDIIKIKEHNHFFAQPNKINIFKLARGQQLFISPSDHLQSKTFNFHGVIEKNYTFKISIYREISRLSRHGICGIGNVRAQIQKYLNSHELKINVFGLTFEDMLNISTNRICSQSAQGLLKQNMVVVDNYSQSSQEQSEVGFLGRLLMDKNLQNTGLNYVRESHEEQEIAYYSKLNYLANQEQIARKIKLKLEKLKQIYKFQSKALNNQIKDRQYQNRLSDQAKTQIKKILSQSNKTKSFDRIVRQRKVDANKNNSILLKYTTDMLKEKNQAIKINKILQRKYP